MKQLLHKFYPFAKQRLGFDKDVKISLLDDPKNAAKPLGKTAYYDPGKKLLAAYVTDRHPKDVVRSISHELVHHHQNCRGDFDGNIDMAGEQGYAQKDPHLREMEREAFEQGNMIFRDFEDGEKANQQTIYERRQGDNKTMSEKQIKEVVSKVIKKALKERKMDLKRVLKEYSWENGADGVSAGASPGMPDPHEGDDYWDQLKQEFPWLGDEPDVGDEWNSEWDGEEPMEDPMDEPMDDEMPMEEGCSDKKRKKMNEKFTGGRVHGMDVEPFSSKEQRKYGKDYNNLFEFLNNISKDDFLNALDTMYRMDEGEPSPGHSLYEKTKEQSRLPGDGSYTPDDRIKVNEDDDADDAEEVNESEEEEEDYTLQEAMNKKFNMLNERLMNRGWWDKSEK